MAYPPNFKSLQIVREVTEKMTQRLWNYSATTNYVYTTDTLGNPAVQIGVASASWSTGNNYAVIVCQGVSTVFQDALGNTLQQFAPSYLQVCLESSATSGVPVEPIQWLGPLLDEAGRSGAIVQLYLTANTVQPTTSSNTAGNLVLTMSPETQWPLAAS